uniref:Uncharacterized protein n=1 Tax=Cannabis sativa TaxID=3483 RepID=A0A803NVZ5_CANSA
MGNCFAKPKKLSSPVMAPVSVSVPVTLGKPKKKSTAEIVPHDHHSTVRLYGTPISSHTAYIRFALQHKGVPVRFTPSISDPPLIEVGSERVSGSRESLLQYIESKFPNPPLAVKKCNGEDAKPWVVTLTALQHRSMTWHVERLLRWSEDLGARGGKKRGGCGGGIDPRVGTPKMEVKKFNRSYSQLLELMLEHAQMEEREHCKEHFVEEEIQVLPYIEATELSKPKQRRVLEQSLDVMQGTHSRLFNFFLEGLLPLDAMQYLDLVAMCHDEERMSSMLQMIEETNNL